MSFIQATESKAPTRIQVKRKDHQGFLSLGYSFEFEIFLCVVRSGGAHVYCGDPVVVMPLRTITILERDVSIPASLFPLSFGFPSFCVFSSAFLLSLRFAVTTSFCVALVQTEAVGLLSRMVIPVWLCYFRTITISQTSVDVTITFLNVPFLSLLRSCYRS